MTASLDLRAFPDAAAFVREVAVPMARDEIANNVFLILADQMAAKPEPGQLRHGVFEKGECRLAAWMTPPYRLGLADLGHGEETARALALRLVKDRIAVPGVTGPKRLALAFADSWIERAGGRIDPAQTMDQNFYRIEALATQNHVPGSMRQAAAADRDLLCDWMAAFAEDADLPPSEQGRAFAAPRVDRAIETGCAFLWEDAGQAAACAIERPYRTVGSRISSVFTARDRRGRGYGAAMTAALSQRILDKGRWCVLFADANNALTNRLYQRLGYRFQAVYSDIHFVQD
jgi:uncharacterized protein